MNLERHTYQDFKNYLIDKLFPNLDSEEIDSTNNKLKELLQIEFSQYMSWYWFIIDEQQTDIVYHTYHGTKGAEFKNAIIIMENDFGIRNKNKFSSFFRNHKDRENIQGEDLLKFNNTKNLLYVSCSRSIKNLRILYLDDISEFKDGIKNIFGEVYKYEI